ncbi:MAG: hypothetical protein DRH24_02315 [Deltaproteobacteria bacterium]|nr:MAG: hypothetical protein DRH24_02315 [Deltaproteobacteria bacterium]
MRRIFPEGCPENSGKKLIIRSLKATAGNRSKAAKMLEISHPSLLSKIKAYDINL